MRQLPYQHGEFPRTAVGAALTALGTGVRALAERMRQASEARAILQALRELDSRTLHDLGLNRSEVLSVTLDGDRHSVNPRLRFAQAENTLRLT